MGWEKGGTYSSTTNYSRWSPVLGSGELETVLYIVGPRTNAMGRSPGIEQRSSAGRFPLRTPVRLTSGDQRQRTDDPTIRLRQLMDCVSFFRRKFKIEDGKIFRNAAFVHRPRERHQTVLFD